jgi:hypothetical protein
MIKEQFFGSHQKRIKGACTQLIAREGACHALYEITEGEHNLELVLMPSCCGKDTSLSYVTGVYFTAKDIFKFGVNKKVRGRALWAMGLLVLCLIKKTLSMVPKLSPWIVIIKKNVQ